MDERINRQLARLFPDVEQHYGRCARKVAYATIEDAIIMRERRQARAGISLSFYHCDSGEHYHLSKQPPSPEQAAHLWAAYTEQKQGMIAELMAYEARWEALMRQAEAVGRALGRRARALTRIQPSPRLIAELTDNYTQQRDDYIRLEDLLEQVLDLDLRHDMILARAEAILAHPDDLRAGLAAWQERCEALQAEAEDTRQADAAGLHRQLARLEASHTANLERARTWLTAQYLGVATR